MKQKSDMNKERDNLYLFDARHEKSCTSCVQKTRSSGFIITASGTVLNLLLPGMSDDFPLTEKPYSDKMNTAKTSNVYSYPGSGSIHEIHLQRRNSDGREADSRAGGTRGLRENHPVGSDAVPQRERAQAGKGGPRGRLPGHRADGKRAGHHDLLQGSAADMEEDGHHAGGYARAHGLCR